ncbi:MAG: hypothetical protein LUF34_04950 [Lachnospiraceae bacterium]|nr:hypothetical protein [Lachnospiraceae bacterium]
MINAFDDTFIRAFPQSAFLRHLNIFIQMLILTPELSDPEAFRNLSKRLVVSAVSFEAVSVQIVHKGARDVIYSVETGFSRDITVMISGFDILNQSGTEIDTSQLVAAADAENGFMQFDSGINHRQLYLIQLQINVMTSGHFLIPEGRTDVRQSAGYDDTVTVCQILWIQ